MKKLNESSIQVTHCDLHHISIIIIIIIEKKDLNERYYHKMIIFQLIQSTSVLTINYWKQLIELKVNIVRTHALDSSAPLSINNSIQLKYFPISSVCISMKIRRFTEKKTQNLFLQSTERDCCCTCNSILFSSVHMQSAVQRKRSNERRMEKWNSRHAMSAYRNPEEVFRNLFFSSSRRKRI